MSYQLDKSINTLYLKAVLHSGRLLHIGISQLIGPSRSRYAYNIHALAYVQTFSQREARSVIFASPYCALSFANSFTTSNFSSLSLKIGSLPSDSHRKHFMTENFRNFTSYERLITHNNSQYLPFKHTLKSVT